jgi:Putative porin
MGAGWRINFFETVLLPTFRGPFLSTTPSSCVIVLLLHCTIFSAQPRPDCLPIGSGSLNADLSLRFDNVYSLSDRPDIHRVRGWARPGFDLTPTAWLHAGARGSFALSSDENSQNIPRFDNFHSDDISLDRLYLAVHRSSVEACAGKFAMPFQVSEMVWDADIQPTGVYVALRHSRFTLRGGLFHRSHIHHDRSTIAGGQVTFRNNSKGRWAVETNGGYFAFNALDLFQPGMERQNRALLSDGRLRYLSSFELANGRFRLEYSGVGRWPLVIESTIVYNFGAPNERRAAEVRAQIGKLEERRDWQFTYSFQRVERDAVVGAFTSDDWWYHSDFSGSRFTAAFSPLFPMFFQFSAVLQKRNNTDNLVKRFQLDVGARF